MIVFFDFETYSEIDLSEVGVYKYVEHPSTRPICAAFAIDGGPVLTWEAGQDIPAEVLAAREAGALFVAHNAQFDREVWNRKAPFSAHPLAVEQVLCCMAQAEGSSLPGGLGPAAECLKAPVTKNPDGKLLMRKFCGPWAGDPATPDEWARFVRYCADDVETMRGVWLRSRPMSRAEWGQYHASERVNVRGLPVDAEFAQRASAVAELAVEGLNDQLRKLTGDPSITFNHHVRKAEWLRERLTPEQLDLVRTDKGGVSASREARSELWACEDLSDEVEQFLDICDDANTAALTKLPKIPALACVDGRLHGIYAFNGAGQTGRWSARGYQAHNLINKPYKRDDPNAALDAMDFICSNPPEVAVRWLEEHSGMSALEALGRLLRPLVAAQEGHDLVWGDWASIEARVLPWLSGRRGADKLLDVFRKDRDVYIETAAAMYRVDPSTIAKDDPRRQEGKIAQLSLGYQGGQRALRNMAKKMGVRMTRDEAQKIVDKWRAANPWAVGLWSDMNDAAKEAVSNPEARFKAGKLTYRYVSRLMGGTLTCQLPSGRLLCYPRARLTAEEDVLGRRSVSVEYRRPRGRAWVRGRLYGGILTENATQAVANCLLRDLLVRLIDAPVVGHTHDEVMLEVPTTDVEAWTTRLDDMMVTAPDWAVGLPLKAEVKHGPFWTK